MKPGSIEDIVARLTLWAKRAPKGLARVEFDSEFSRESVVNQLRSTFAEAGIAFHEIDLPLNTPASLLVRTLMEQLNSLSDGVVSIIGFSTAFQEDTSLEDALRVFNFNRENLTPPALRQIWWMPPSFAEQFIRAVPDLNSWFLVRLHLTETSRDPRQSQEAVEPFEKVQEEQIPIPEVIDDPRRPPALNIGDARKRAQDLVTRFERGLEAGVTATELRNNFAIPAEKALREAGAEKEAHELVLTLAQKIAQAAFPQEEPRVDFFISYNNADRAWVEWIAWQLEEAGYTTVLQAWDFQPGSNFVLEMQKATTAAQRTIAVLSPDYLSSRFTQPEWAAAFARDPTGEKRILLPVRVRECNPEGLLGPIVYTDLVGLEENAARDRLISGLCETRAKPTTEPSYPETKPSYPEAPAFPLSLPSLWNLPHPRNSFFTGREEVLQKLHETLSAHGSAALAQTRAISGLGGIGKTQTAVEYAYRHRDEYEAVLWAKADTQESLTADFVAIARLLNLPERKEKDQSVIVASVKRWFENNTHWLLILDNADAPKLVADFLPTHAEGHILLTSRAQVFDALGVVNPVVLEKLLPDEAKEFLLKRTGRSNSELEETQSLTELVQELDCLPLALESAGAYIVRKQCSFRNYLSSYQKRGLDLLEKTGSIVGQYPKSVATTWSLNFEQVEQESEASADLLRFSAFLHPDKIPVELITLGIAELGPALSPALTDVDQDPLVLDEVLEPLTQYSLIRRDLAAQTYDIHRLVQVVLRGGMDEATQRLWAERTVRAVSRAFPRVEFTAWQRCERLLLHFQSCVELIKKWRLDFVEAALLLNQGGIYLHQRARLQNTEPLFLQSLSIMQKAFGPDHPDVAAVLHNLAAIYHAQGKYSEAEPLYKRSLAIREKILGADHSDVGQTVNSLGGLYQAQDKYTQAEPLFKRALMIHEKALGAEHPDVATDLNNLALLYKYQKKYSEAEPLYKQSLTIRKKTLGMNHPDVALSISNLGALYYAQKEYAQAEPLYEQSLEIRDNILGADHPDLAESLNNLAVLYRVQGHYSKADPLYQRALKILENSQGPDHPNLVTYLENYATLLRETNQSTKAAELEARAQAIRAKQARPQAE